MKVSSVLLVDDERAVNFLNKIVLDENCPECGVAVADNGKKALDYLAENECPDLIFLDLNMPVMDGFEFLDEFEKQQRCVGHSKIFVLTSSLRDEDRELALSKSTVSGYLPKPLTEEHLKTVADILAM